MEEDDGLRGRPTGERIANCRGTVDSIS